MSEREDWRKRRCAHGPVDVRVWYDIAHCSRPGCWEAVLASVGLMMIPEPAEPAPQPTREPEEQQG